MTGRRAGLPTGADDAIHTYRADHPLLADLAVLRLPGHDGQPQHVVVGGKQILLDDELGLVRR